MARRIRLLGGVLGIAMFGLVSAPFAQAQERAPFRVSALNVSLTVQMTGRGHVTSNPAGIDCVVGTGACSATFPAGTSVTLAGTPGTGYELRQLASCFDQLTCTVNVGANGLVIDAVFIIDSSLWLEIAGGGTVRATPLDVPAGTGEDGVTSCGAGSPSPTPLKCQLHVLPGRRVLLEVVPDSTGSTFIGWSDPACADQPTCTVMMPTVPGAGDHSLFPYDLTVAATFGPIPVGVIVAFAGGGSVSSSPPGIDCTFTGDYDNAARCMHAFVPGTTVTLHAENPVSITWDPSTCTIVPGSPSDCTLRVTTSVWVGLSLGTPDRPLRDSSGPEVLVRFQVGKTGLGSGHVSGAGIDCGTSCTSDYVFGYLESFTATADPGSHFAGWTGGGCSDTDGNCMLTAGAASRIFAKFEPDAATPPATPITTPGATSGTPIGASAAASTSHFVVRLTAASAIRRGRQRALRVRISTATPVTAAVTTRGPHSLVLRRTYHLHPPVAWLQVPLPRHAKLGRYRLTISVTDGEGRTRILRSVVTLR